MVTGWADPSVSSATLGTQRASERRWGRWDRAWGTDRGREAERHSEERPAQRLRGRERSRTCEAAHEGQ